MNQENTVVLPLDKYNELREFKEQIEKGSTYISETQSRFSWKVRLGFLTKDETAKQMGGLIKVLNSDIVKLENELHEMKSKAVSIKKLKSLSWWGLIRFARKLKQ